MAKHNRWRSVYMSCPRNLTEAAVERLRDLNWRYKFGDGVAGAISCRSDLTPPKGLHLWQRFPSAILMDCAYRTNKVSIANGQSIIVGGTDLGLDKLGSPYSRLPILQKAAPSLLHFWLSQQRKGGGLSTGSRLAATRIDDSSAIKVILVDCEIGLVNTLDSALPTA